MKQNNKTCICCGEIYTFCTGCGQFDNEPRWKAIYHNETCKDIFIIIISISEFQSFLISLKLLTATLSGFDFTISDV